jgi:hypothetical protein
METNVSLKVPDREPDEPDITDKQAAFIRQLLSGIGGANAGINYQSLGKWQASSLIDQLIELRDAGAQVISKGSPASASRKMSIILGLGIFIAPYIFAWATLRPGYTVKARAISFAWLALMVFPFFMGAK